jgi:hypothetical protein
MRAELDRLLCFKYPGIFAQRWHSMKNTAMCWGFTCGDGWFNIIDNLCRKIHRSGLGNTVQASQVKEKMGGLRFYTDIAPGTSNTEYDLIWAYTDFAELKSYTTCERCGKQGSLTERRGWLKTLCIKHQGEENAAN